jgi:cysteinyl-tRNA synthetase
MQWPSPWGSGYPGWHIECSAMSMKYLGETIDIHGGGIENQFPHHECEIAQSECATGKPFVRYWMHHNMVNVGGQKMGKSLGNSAFLKDIFTEFEPLVLRFFLLQGHYRAPIEFQPDAIRAAGAGLEKLQTAARRLAARLADPAFVAPPRKDVAEPLDASAYRRRFEEAMDDDFNTPIAIGVLFNLAHETNRRLESGAFSRAEMDVTNLAFRTLGGDVLGIIPADHNAIAGPSIDAELIQLFIKLRAEARSRKDFATSDRIRDGLDQIGIALEDGKDGTSWKRI